MNCRRSKLATQPEDNEHVKKATIPQNKAQVSSVLKPGAARLTDERVRNNV